MWGWGRNSKDDDSSSTGNNNSRVSGSGALTGFSLPSPRSPMSLGGGPKKHTSFYGAKSGNGNKISSTNEQPNKQHQRRRSWGGKDRRSGPNTSGEVLSAVTIMEKASSLHSSEAYSGIEVSLSQDKSVQRGTGAVASSFVSASLAPAQKFTPIVAISLQQQLAERQKVYRAQFQSVISNAPSNSDGQAPASPLSTRSKQFDSSNFNKSKNHRLPLFDSKDPSVSYENAFSLLKDYTIREEGQCIKDEIEQTDNEIAAIEHDRNEIEKRWIASKSFTAATTVESKDDVNGAGDSSTSSLGIEWDTNRTLAVRKNLSSERIRELQLERGVSLTISLENPKALESLLSKCGGKATTNVSKSASANKAKQNGNLVTTLRPSNDKASDAACTIQQVCLMKAAGSETSFLISRDTGSTFFHGRLPDRLFRRMKNKSNGNGTGAGNIGRPVNAYDASSDQSPNARDILYLSTGPFGCYYTEFRSGECWWGLTADDDELDAIFSEWDVYKIAFGPCVTIEPSVGNSYKSTSWIVIARDGRAAWKNLPSRLHHKLSSRLANETSPQDVSLGSEGSYFVRFLDGSSDWQLPSRTAEVCKSLEIDGYQVTSISLHPELSHDFIIRHR